MLTVEELANTIECILFLSPEPVKAGDMEKHLDVDSALMKSALELLNEKYTSGGLELLKVAGGYQLTTRREYIEHLKAYFGGMDRTRVSRSTLETLAVVAYKQPVARAEIDAIRGVNSSGSIRSLLDKGLIKISSREETPGRPFLFSTTDQFLIFLGMDKIEDLPPLESFEKKI